MISKSMLLMALLELIYGLNCIFVVDDSINPAALSRMFPRGYSATHSKSDIIVRTSKNDILMMDMSKLLATA